MRYSYIEDVIDGVLCVCVLIGLAANVAVMIYAFDYAMNMLFP